MEIGWIDYGWVNLVGIFFSFLPALALGCDRSASSSGSCDRTRFGTDVAFLGKHADVIVIESPDTDGMVAVAPSLQARVMTSSAAGETGISHGWINRELIESGEKREHINVFGGEDRFWIGPEGGQFSIFFRKGDPFDLAHWQTPEPVDWGGWDLASEDGSSAAFSRSFSLENFSGTMFDIRVDRTITVYSRRDIAAHLGVEPGDDVGVVGFQSDNRMKNTGDTPWIRDNGLLSIWILGMFNPGLRTIVVAPFNPGPVSEIGPVVNDSYFGRVPRERLTVDEKGFVFFRGDGRYRCKIGLSPRRAKDVMGSYDPDSGVLTIVRFSFTGDTGDYVNSMWEIQEDPFSGDVSNSYNDGPPGPGEDPLGPFYEIESSSPAASLDPGESMGHVHMTFHLEGSRDVLDFTAESVLGVGLEEITGAFADEGSRNC